ncbi:MAG: helix-turn-helix domain-containing protein, partial [Eubacteriales bacterium]
MNQLIIGKFIARKRKEKNLTQEQLAEKLGVSNKTVSKWECGKCMPDYSIV